MNRNLFSYAAAAALALGLASPAFADDSTGSSGMTPSFSEADVNQDGFVDEAELQSATGSMDSVALYDTDGDGMLSEEEFGSIAMGSGSESSTDTSTQ